MSSFVDFFKVYLTTRSLNSMLIPSRAIVCPLMPGTITLRNCKGHCWLMDVVERDNKMYFDKGWTRYINENSVRDGNFLVFSYVGNAMYDVKVFGSDACERVEVEEIREQEDDVEEEEEEEEEEKDDGDDDDDMKDDQGTSSRQVKDKKRCPENYVDHLNPYFVAKTTSSRRKNELHVPSHVIKDYNLSLGDGDRITFIDANNVWKSIGTVVKWKDQRTCIKGWTSVYNRNRLEHKNATCICEFLLDKEQETENGYKTKFIKVNVIEASGQN